ncbi:hypothetical protein Vadar_005553 [Vaccinium darrowii]|uniref:Uncharacterized protein n=1 Tax=Vaccinium darrowii TaxID=229202 RepID=A0ACB7WXW5_9ERIC|nr:hypothetical protein Vadar_005553 [Vaccinium darrowii]
MAYWADLVQDLLILIARRVDFVEDFAAFGRVCRSWRLVAVKENFKGSQQIPWLMLAEEEEEEEEEGEGDDKNNRAVNGRRFVSITEGVVIGKLMLPEARGKRCLETRGWLVTISESGDMNLLHPLTRVQVSLPPITTLKYYYEDEMYNTYIQIQKAVLSSSPSGSSKDDYVLMIIYGGSGFLGFCRCGDKAWTTIETRLGCFMDITYFNGQFYAVNARGMIYVCDVGGRNPTEACPVGSEIQYTVAPNDERRPYIVELEGNLLIVIRDGYYPRFLGDYGNEGINEDDIVDESKIEYGTREFLVFKVDVSNWRGTELHNLGDNALFLGDNASIFVKASKFSGLRPNCIYYTDDCWPSYIHFKRGGGKEHGYLQLERWKPDCLL